jgi:hypothetical protein
MAVYSHSLRQVSAGNCGRHRVVPELYKREELRYRPLLYIKARVYNFVIVPSNGIIKCMPIKLLK